jgi:hypothetical protein
MHQPDIDRVDQDLAVRQLPGERLVERVARGAMGGGGEQTGHHYASRNRVDVDNARRRAFLQQRQRGARASELPENFQFVVGQQLLVGERSEGAMSGGAGIVHQNIEPAVGAADFVH